MQIGDAMTENKHMQIKKMFQTFGPIIKSGMLRQHKVYNREIAELLSNGDIIKVKSGYYLWNDFASEISDVETVAALIPFGIICLQSAASYHGLTTLNPLAVTVAIPASRTRVALPVHPPVDLVAYPISTFELGLLNENCSIRIYDRERTVCDFIRKRKQLGEDLALDVLRTYMRGTRNMQKLFDYARILRVRNVMKPYVEALL